MNKKLYKSLMFLAGAIAYAKPGDDWQYSVEAEEFLIELEKYIEEKIEGKKDE